MKELKAGLRFSPEEGISFFGLDEVNAAIERGARFIAIKELSCVKGKKAADIDVNLFKKITLVICYFAYDK